MHVEYEEILTCTVTMIMIVIVKRNNKIKLQEFFYSLPQVEDYKNLKNVCLTACSLGICHSIISSEVNKCNQQTEALCEHS